MFPFSQKSSIICFIWQCPKHVYAIFMKRSLTSNEKLKNFPRTYQWWNLLFYISFSLKSSILLEKDSATCVFLGIFWIFILPLDDCYCTKNEVFHLGFLQKMWPNPLEIADLVTCTEEIFNGRLHFLCSVLEHLLC